jgi:hypothetical protein
MRVLDIYHFLRFTQAGKEIVKIMPSSDEVVVSAYVAEKQNESKLYSVSSSISHSYNF